MAIFQDKKDDIDFFPDYTDYMDEENKLLMPHIF